MSPTRQKVVSEFSELSDDALIAVVERVLARDEDATEEAFQAFEPRTGTVCNVAERLLTGKRAEEFFTSHSFEIVNIPANRIIDARHRAAGYDFADPNNPQCAIEVKGLRASNGSILFTDRGWQEAACRASDYWLVVVGNLDDDPLAKVFRDPCSTLDATCTWHRSVTASWRAVVALT